MAIAISVPFFVTAQTAKIQILHNAADPAAASVDVYVNGSLLINNFKYRTAFGYADVPAGVPLAIAIAPDTSTSSSSKIFDKTVTLEAGGTYVAIANGVLNPGMFSQNNDANAKPLAFDVYAVGGRTTSTTPGSVDLFAWHGATDAPAVDVVVGETRLIEGLSYGSASAYRTVPPGVYDLGIAPTGGQPIATFRADVSALGGAAIIVVASGFLNPEANGNGPAFGLFAVAPTGGAFITLPSVPTQQFAQVQIVHNASDPATKVVDVWAGSTKLVDDFAFRSATPFLEVPAGVSIPIGIALSNSESAAESIATFNVTFEPGRYIVVANGLLVPAFFPKNTDPDAAPRDFSLFPIADIRPRTSIDGNVDIVVFHGATDAPKVDVLAGESRLVEDLSYGSNSDYVSVPAGSYVLDVAPAGGAPIASFTADVTSLSGKAIAVIASGFLVQPNNGGWIFGLFAVLPEGGPLLELQRVTTSVEEAAGFTSALSVSPNPATNNIRVSFGIVRDASVAARLVDVTGSVVANFDLGFSVAGQHNASISVANVPTGPYYLMIDSGFGSASSPVTVIR